MTACTSEVGDLGSDTGDVSSALNSSRCTLSKASILAKAKGARRVAIERGFTWYDAKVPYSQSKWRNDENGKYRTDCSGFVSMCWQLGTSYTTAEFNSGGAGTSRIGAYSNLLPGDGLVRRSGGSGHIVLFLGWNDAAGQSACVLEQASTAQDMQFRVRTKASLTSGGYKAIRADRLKSTGGTSPAGNDNDTDEPAADGTGGDSAGDGTPPDDSAGNGTPSDDSAGNGTPPDDSAGDGFPPDDGAGDGTPGGQRCASSGACNPGDDGSGLICVGGYCTPGCTSDAHCPGSTVCIGGQCL